MPLTAADYIINSAAGIAAAITVADIAAITAGIASDIATFQDLILDVILTSFFTLKIEFIVAVEMILASACYFIFSPIKYIQPIRVFHSGKTSAILVKPMFFSLDGFRGATNMPRTGPRPLGHRQWTCIRDIV